MKERDLLLVKVRAQIRAMKAIRKFKKEMEKNVNHTNTGQRKPAAANQPGRDISQYGG